MSSPQDGPARKKQKARRRKKLAMWREKNPAAEKPVAEKPAAKKAAKKSAAKKPAAAK
jgi:hypothetical protein